MVLTENEKWLAFDLIFFDLEKGSFEKVICSDEFIKEVCAVHKCGSSEEIGYLYFEKLGWTIKPLYRVRNHPRGYPDLEISKDGVVRFLEMKNYPDTIKFNQMCYLMKKKGIIGYVLMRNNRDNCLIDQI